MSGKEFQDNSLSFVTQFILVQDVRANYLNMVAVLKPDTENFGVVDLPLICLFKFIKI